MRLIGLAGIVAGCVLTAAFVARCALGRPTGATVAGANGLYVWQRHWSAQVEAAVRSELEAGTHDLYLLEGELEYNGAAAQWHWAEVPDYFWRNPRVTAVFRLPVPALDSWERNCVRMSPFTTGTTKLTPCRWRNHRTCHHGWGRGRKVFGGTDGRSRKIE